jgi:hypothetical protein
MNKKVLWTIVILAVAALVAYGAWYKDRKTKSAVQTNAQHEETTTTPGLVIKAEKPPANSPTPALSYTEALKRYGDNRIQFDTSCQMHPNNVVFKKGTLVMFDNRANHARNINFNGQKLSIPAYNYAVLPMTASTYPSPVYVDCDSQQNVGRILIEQ